MYDSHVFLILTAVNCGPLTNPINGRFSHTAGTTFGKTATYSCNTGYRLVGDTIRICQATRVWSGSPPTCQGMSLLLMCKCSCVQNTSILLTASDIYLHVCAWASSARKHLILSILLRRLESDLICTYGLCAYKHRTTFEPHTLVRHQSIWKKFNSASLTLCRYASNYSWRPVNWTRVVIWNVIFSMHYTCVISEVHIR